MIDMKQPINIDVEKDSAVITTSSLEQVGEEIDSFIDFVLSKKPKRVINIEPILEFSENNEFDNLMKLYCEKRNYLKYYYSKLLQLERENKIKILFKKRTRVAGLFDRKFSYSLGSIIMKVYAIDVKWQDYKPSGF